MSATNAEAVKEMYDIIINAWNANGPAQTEIQFQNQKSKVPTDNHAAWLRVTLQHTPSQQGSLSGNTGKRRWQRNGFIIVQVFSLIGDGLRTRYDFAKIISDAFEGYDTPCGVWFRNISALEAGDDGTWFQTNVSIDFEYDEVK